MLSRSHFSVCMLVLVCTAVLFSQEASSQYTLNVNLTTDSPLNCSAGLTYPGVFLLVEYRWLEGTGSDEITPSQWMELDRIILEPTEKIDLPSLDNTSVSRLLQLRIVQPEHGGRTCNCWRIGNPVVYSNGTELKSNMDISLCHESQASSSNVMDWVAFDVCGGNAGTQRGMVYQPIRLNGNDSYTIIVDECNNGDVVTVVTDVKGLPPINCSDTEPKIELSYEVLFNNKTNAVLFDGDNKCDPIENFDEGVEVSLGNWDNDGDWVPLAYHTSKSGSQTFLQSRGYDVPYYTKAGMFSVSVCGERFLRDGFQIRWLQQVSFINKGGQYVLKLRDLITLDNVSVTVYANQTASKTILNEGFDEGPGAGNITRLLWKSDIRNGGISTHCTRSLTDFKIVLGLTCETLDCNLDPSYASRIATTAPLNISDTRTTQSPTTISETTQSPTTMSETTQSPTTMPDTGTTQSPTTMSDTGTTQSPTTMSDTGTTQSPTTMPPLTTTSSYEASAVEDLKSAISTVSNAINESEQLMSVLEELKKNPNVAATMLQELVTMDTEVNVAAVVYLLGSIVDRASEVNDSRALGQAVVEVSEVLLQRTKSSNESNTVAGSTLLTTIEQLAFALDNNITSANLELVVREIAEETDDTYFAGIVVDSSSIQVPSELVREVANGTGPVTVAAVYYRNMSGLLPGTLPGESGSVLASPVVSTSLQCGQGICDTTNVELSQPVIVTLKHSLFAQDNSEETVCVFWEFIIAGSDSQLVNGQWNTRGCKRNDSLSNATQTVCECTHLTNFAILLSSQPIVGGVHGFVLDLIGYIGVSLSVLAMLLTITTLVYLRSLWSMRNFIHINLCLSLILAQLTFVIGVTSHEGGGSVVGPGCQTAAVLMHYLFLVSFMWMLMEGVVLYVALVKVFVKNQRRYMIGFFLFSYGVPLLYMALCVPLGFLLYPSGHHGYGYVHYTNATNDTVAKETTICWLNPLYNFILTFIVPVVLIVVVNICFFIMALVIMVRHAKKETHKTRIQGAKYWLKGSVSLVTVMGLTWIIGVLVFEVPALFPLAYIFTILVAFQGVAIFIIFVPMSKQVREAYSKWWRVKVAESDFLSRHFGDWSFTSNRHSTAFAKKSSEQSTSNIYQLESSITKLRSDSNKSTDTLQSTVSLDDMEEESSVFGTAFNTTINYPRWNASSTSEGVCIKNCHANTMINIHGKPVIAEH